MTPDDELLAEDDPRPRRRRIDSGDVAVGVVPDDSPPTALRTERGAAMSLARPPRGGRDATAFSTGGRWTASRESSKQLGTAPSQQPRAEDVSSPSVVGVGGHDERKDPIASRHLVRRSWNLIKNVVLE